MSGQRWGCHRGLGKPADGHQGGRRAPFATGEVFVNRHEDLAGLAVLGVFDLNLISWWQEGIEPNDEVDVSVKQLGDSLNYPKGYRCWRI